MLEPRDGGFEGCLAFIGLIGRLSLFQQSDDNIQLAEIRGVAQGFGADWFFQISIDRRPCPYLPGLIKVVG